MQVKITDPGFAGFTGHFGSVYFEDGVSEHISNAEAERLGCIVKCETLDGVNPSATQRMVDIQSKNLDELLAMGKGVDGADRNKAQNGEIKSSVAKPGEEPPAAQTGTATPAGVKPSLDFTREDLEALADKDGIAGLRNIGSQHGVKGRSITEIINELMVIKQTAEQAGE